MHDRRQTTGREPLVPALGVRITALPARAADSLTCRDVREALEALAEATARARRGRAELVDALGEEIRRLPPAGSPSRPRLVGLRRAVHADRRPGPGEWTPEIAAAVGGPVRDAVRGWLDGRAARAALTARLRTAVEESQEDLTRALLAHTACRAVDHGLRQADRELAALAERVRGGTSRLARKPAGRLTRFVVRSAVKTSPYSSLTAVGLAAWAPSGPAVAVHPQATGHPRSVVEVNRFVLDAVRAAAPRTPGDRVRVHPRLVRAGARLLLLPADAGRIAELRLPAAEEAVVDALLDAPDGLPAEDAAGAVHGPAQEAERALGALFAAGLLLRTGAPSRGECQVRALWQDLALRPDPFGRTELVRTLHQTVCAPAPTCERGSRALTDRAAELTSRLAATVPGLTRPTARDALFETCVVPGTAATCSRRAWRGPLRDLRAVRRWLALFDENLPLRLALAQRHLARFGPGTEVPLAAALRLAADEGLTADEWLADPAAVPAGAADAPDRVRRLRELRAAETDRILKSAADGGGHLEPDDLLSTAGIWPRWVPRPDPGVAYVQPWQTGDGLAVVVNLVLAGPGRGLTRLGRLLESARVPVPAAQALPAVDDGPPFAELAGAHGYSMDDRLPGAPLELDLTGEPTASAVPRLTPARLRVRHDPDAGLLELVYRAQDGSTARIRPVHLGMTAESHLSWTARFLLRAFGPVGQCNPALGLRALLPRHLVPGRPHGAVALPRTRVGAVVLRRARWVTRARDIPSRSPGEHEADHMLRLANWMRDQGIPQRCFVRTLPGTEEGPTASGARPRPTDTKPLLLDTASCLLVRAARNLMTGHDRAVAFDEVLPPLPAGRPGADGHVAEFMVPTPQDRWDGEGCRAAP
ncbi:hypothetical protein ACLIYP_00805 [Streptomyces nanhaiensis]|uniref:hypothetical protein n=1 Tax=Streptomyces nanhaiensis TaxID=679319 RepID=UPI00399D401A